MKNSRSTLIRQILMQDGKVNCNDLCDRFGISPATIRRDLNKLEEEGLIRRTYGGAELIRGRSQEAMEINTIPAWSVRQDTCAEEKKAIAREVVKMIPDNSTVFIDSGTTVFEIAKLLTNKSNLTVVSNSMRASAYLGMFPNIQLYFLGGKIAHSMLASSGIMASACLAYFTRIDYCIVSSDAFSVEDGMREHFMETAILKKALIEKSNVVIAALDHSKFGKTASAPICNCSVSDINVLVTDSDISSSDYLKLKEKNINVVIAETKDE